VVSTHFATFLEPSARYPAGILLERLAPADSAIDLGSERDRVALRSGALEQVRRLTVLPAIVSNARDLAVFFGALLRGELVPPRLLSRM
jgi:hypothetical protein